MESRKISKEEEKLFIAQMRAQIPPEAAVKAAEEAKGEKRLGTWRKGGSATLGTFSGAYGAAVATGLAATPLGPVVVGATAASAAVSAAAQKRVNDFIRNKYLMSYGAKAPMLSMSGMIEAVSIADAAASAGLKSLEAPKLAGPRKTIGEAIAEQKYVNLRSMPYATKELAPNLAKAYNPDEISKLGSTRVNKIKLLDELASHQKLKLNEYKFASIGSIRREISSAKMRRR